MSKLSRFWDWLLPGLICLSPMGAMAYFTAGAEIEALHYESKNAERRSLAAGARMGAIVIPIARL